MGWQNEIMVRNIFSDRTDQPAWNWNFGIIYSMEKFLTIAVKCKVGGAVLVAALVACLAVGRASASVEAPVRVTLTFDDSLKDHLLIAAPLLEERGWRGTFNLVTDWVGKGDKFLTWDDVRELVRRGHEIATHTKTHPNLVKMLAEQGEAAVRSELAESRDAIADAVGFTPRYMCSPYVKQNDDTARLCRDEGLKQMLASRMNFGQGTEGRTRQIIESRIASGAKRLDILHHGISAKDRGGWRPFCDRAAFERHLDDLVALEREGKIVVTDYDGMVSDCVLAAKEWPRHGVLALSFDDRNMADWERAFPLFEKYGASATFFICGAIGSNEVAFARKALSMGHEVGLHGLKHRNAPDAVASLGQDGYWEAEIAPQLSAFREAGVPIRSFAYPNCRRNDATDAIFAAHGFTRVRGTPDGVTSPNPHDPKGEKLDKWRPVATSDEVFVPAARQLTSQLIGNVIMGENYHTDIEDILRAMRRAGERAETLSIVSHGIKPDAKGISMKTEWLERMLSEAGACGVVVKGV